MIFIQAGSLFAFLAVACGAMGAHALRSVLSSSQLDTYHTAVTYMMCHALGLIGFGLFCRFSKLILTWPGFAFVIGIILFSGSLFMLLITRQTFWGYVTPFGGLLFLMGWLGFFWETWKISKNKP